MIFDVESGTERALPGAVSPSLDLTAAPPLVMAAPFVVNLETEKVIGTGERWLTELGDDQLREVLALRPDAVED